MPEPRLVKAVNCMIGHGRICPTRLTSSELADSEWTVYLVDSSVQMYGGSRLCMDTDDVTSSLGEVCNSLLWMHNHLQSHKMPLSMSIAEAPHNSCVASTQNGSIFQQYSNGRSVSRRGEANLTKCVSRGRSVSGLMAATISGPCKINKAGDVGANVDHRWQAWGWKCRSGPYNCDVWDKSAVHDIDVYPVSSSCLNSLDLR